MPEPITSIASAPPVPPPPDEVMNYKPISTWALAGLFFGAAVALTFGVCFIFGLPAKGPLMLPSWVLYTTVLAALISIVLSIVGLVEIATSEGTRVGKNLAKWGLGLSVVSSLGYFAFYGFTYLALIRQADSFLMDKDPPSESGRPSSGFFPRLIESAHDRTQFNSAFLLAMGPDFRKNSDPAKDDKMQRDFSMIDPKQKSLLVRFAELRLVRFLRESAVQAKETGGEVTVEPLEVVDWSRVETGEQGGYYRVIRNYRITTPEVVATVEMAVHCFDAPGEPRAWIAEVLPRYRAVAVQKTFTPLGRSIIRIDEQVYNALKNWANELPPGPLPVPTNAGEKLTKELHAKVNEVLSKDGPAKALTFDAPLSDIYTPWKQFGDRLRMQYPVTMYIPPDRPVLKLDGLVTVESLTPVDPLNFNEDSKVGWRVTQLKWAQLEMAPPVGR